MSSNYNRATRPAVVFVNNGQSRLIVRRQAFSDLLRGKFPMILHKYNGCGNDFILLDYAEDTDYSQLAASLCTKEKYDIDGLIAVKSIRWK